MSCPPVERVSCMWDTGAMISAISDRLASRLDLEPRGYETVSHAGGESEVVRYEINLTLPNGVEFAGLPVLSVDTGDIDVLIGMDIISQCDFALTFPVGIMQFSIQSPSTHDIDFVREAGTDC
jgi:predicted aspartyl protease